MLRTSSVPIIRSYQLYTWQLVCFMQVTWPLPGRVRLEPAWNITIATCTADNSWWWAQKMPETCRVSWQNKNVEYLMHLVGYLYEVLWGAVEIKILTNWNIGILFKIRTFRKTERRRGVVSGSSSVRADGQTACMPASSGLLMNCRHN